MYCLYKQWVSEGGEGGGWIVLCWPYSAGILHSVSDQMQNLPNYFTTPNKMTSENDIKGLVSLKFLRPCCAGIFKLLRNPGINSKNRFRQPSNLAGRYGNLSYSPHIDCSKIRAQSRKQRKTWCMGPYARVDYKLTLKVVTNEKGEASGAVLTIRY